MSASAPSARLPAVPRPRTSRLPRFIAVGVAASGLLTLGSAAFAVLRGRLELLSDAVPLIVRTNAASVAALAGLGMLVIAGGLARRQRRAWWIALGLLTVAGITHLLKDLDVVGSGVNLGMAVVLVTVRREFDARPSPGSIRRALLLAPSMAGAAWLFGWVAIVVHGNDFAPPPTTGQSAMAAFRGLMGLPFGLTYRTPEGRWIPGLLPLLGVAVVVTAFAMALRPVVEGLRRDPEERQRARDLVRRYGDGTLSYFAPREDKNHFFAGRAMVAYRYLWNLAIVSGDPVGHPDDLEGAFLAFVRQARSLGWGVAVLAGRGDLDEVYAEAGLHPFYLGDEALVDPRTFSLEGRPIRKVRQSVHRLERAGYHLEFLPDQEVGPDLRDALAEVTRSWRGRAPERGFTMSLGRGPSPLDPDCLTVVARDTDGRAQGYLHLVPCFGSEPGYSLDEMRRRPTTPNGLTEWMVAQAIRELAKRDCTRLSLNFALLGELFRSESKLSPWQRVELAIVRRLNPFFQIESLHDFNAKFFPSWVPRYIYYEAATGFPRVVLAYLEAEAFTRLPFIGVRARLRERLPSSAVCVLEDEAVGPGVTDLRSRRRSA